MDNFFDFLNEPVEPTVMSKDEWIKRAKQVFISLSNDFGQSFYNRAVSDEQRPEESVCEACKGCGTTTDGQECVIDKEYGDCFTRNFDHDQFQETCEGQMGDIFELLSIDKIE